MIGSGTIGPTAITVGGEGLGLIAYEAFGGPSSTGLMVAHCSNVSCTDATTVVADNSSPSPSGVGTSIAMGADDLALMSYVVAASGALNVGHCSNTFCVPYARRR